MPIRMTSLAQACEQVREFLATSLQDREQPNRVQIGNLAEAAPATPSDPSLVNLLFYRVEPDGSVLGNDPSEPWLVRLHLLVTAFANEDQPSVGHNELRLLGEVAAIFHEHPILDLLDIEGHAVRLNLIPEVLTLEALNQLWSVQGDVGFRPSVGYEIALVPIVSDTPPPSPAPLVGRLDLVAEAGGNGRSGPWPPISRVDLFLADRSSFRSFHVDDPRLPTTDLDIRIVGTGAPQVELVWEVLFPGQAWRRLRPAPEDAPPSSWPVHPAEEADDAPLHTVPLPAADRLPDSGPYQLILRAIAPGAATTAPSFAGAPVILSVHEVTP